jgi:YfiH family protein
MNKIYTISPIWKAPSNITAFTTLALGGYSQGAYANMPYARGLNISLNVGDNSSSVNKNRQLIEEKTNKPIVWLQQIHGNDCVDLDNLNFLALNNIEADASFSSTNNYACAVMTADCLPILVTDTQGKGILAIHAGWRGLANNIIEKSINHYIQKLNINPHSILVWLAPAISCLNFEVGKEVQKVFLFKALEHEIDATNLAFMRNNDKNCADLYALAKIRLKRLAILDINITGGDFCTFFDTRFYSYRRNTITGRMASVICKN